MLILYQLAHYDSRVSQVHQIEQNFNISRDTIYRTTNLVLGYQYISFLHHQFWYFYWFFFHSHVTINLHHLLWPLLSFIKLMSVYFIYFRKLFPYGLSFDPDISVSCADIQTFSFLEPNGLDLFLHQQVTSTVSPRLKKYVDIILVLASQLCICHITTSKKKKKSHSVHKVHLQVQGQHF